MGNDPGRCDTRINFMQDQSLHSDNFPQNPTVLTSDYGRLIEYKLATKYNLSLAQSSSIRGIVRKIYDHKLILDQLIAALETAAKLSASETKNIARDIAGMFLLPWISLFRLNQQEITGYITSLGGNPENYKRFVEEWPRALEEEKNGTYDNDTYLYEDEEDTVSKDDLVDMANIEDEDNLTLEERLVRMQEFFKHGLTEALRSSMNEISKAVNDDLIDLLTEKEIYRAVLEKALTESQEMIGKEKINLGEREFEPTCANWFKDFFAVVGTQEIDAVKIANYILQSQNAKKLTKTDQELLRRLLLLYHNIKLFPSPFAETPVAEWQILPIAYTEQQSTNSLPHLKSVKPSPVTSPLDSVPIPTTKKPTPPTVAPNQELMNLKNMLLQYPPNSLERKAIEEEIRKMES